MPSLHGPESEASTNGVNAQHLDDEVEEPTTGGVWPESYERQVALRAGQGGAPIGYLPSHILLDPGLSHAVTHTLTVMTMFVVDGDRLSLSQYGLAKRLNTSRQALSLIMAKAEAAGLLQRLELDGEVHWRMRWMTPFKRQGGLDAQRQGGLDAQRQGGLDSQGELDVASRTHAHAVVPVLSTSSSVVKDSSRSRKPKAAPIPLSDDERARLHKKYGGFYPSTEALDDVIDIALNHVAVDKAKGEYRYVMGWIQRDIRDRKLFDTNLAAAKARLAKAKGEPTHNPLVSEPAPFLTHSSWDIPETRDRTRD